MFDSHTHSDFSHDGKADIRKLILEAKEKGLKYLAVTEHLDRDYKFCFKERFVRQLNLDKYTSCFDELRSLAGCMTLALGVECGYSKQAESVYAEELEKYKFDVIINSVHTLDCKDLYNIPKRKIPEKKVLYKKYLEAVLDSVKASYDYDIVGHIGYAARYVSYDDVSFMSADTEDLIDEILKEIILRGKTLELNSNTKNLPWVCLPELAVLQRYRELGGDDITFSSDAHTTLRLCDGYAEVSALAKRLGFTHWSIYLNRQKTKITIE